MGLLNHATSPSTAMLAFPMVSLSLNNGIFAIVIAALIAHLIFKRWEPMRMRIVSALVLFAPLALSTLLIQNLGPLTAIYLTSSVYLSTLIASILLYRISPIHPFSHYPGPLISKMTKVWYTWQIRTGKQHLYQEYLHNRYGDVVRIGPNEIMIRDASCIGPFMGPNGLPKAQNWEGRHMFPAIPALVGTRDPKQHALRRRPWNRAFSFASLKEFQPIIANRAHQLVDAIAEHNGEKVDLQQWFNFFTYDFMGDMAFGGWTEMMRDGADLDGLWYLIKSGMYLSMIFEQIPWLAYYTKKIPWLATSFKGMRVMGFSRTDQRYASGSNTKDLFYFLSNEDGAEKVSPPREVVISDGVLAVVAGSDTTSSALSDTFWCLLQNPDMYRRLQEEVDQFYPPGENSLDPKHHSEMHYLEAVLNESLRLLPPVPGGIVRSPEVGKGGQLVGPYYIPEGCMARMSIWNIHRDARNFSHPERFWPDRWLIAEGRQACSEKIVHNAAAFIPFSYGPANCVGKNLAMQEMRTVICHMMQRVQFRFADGYDPHVYFEQFRDNLVVQPGPLPLIVERRE